MRDATVASRLTHTTQTPTVPAFQSVRPLPTNSTSGPRPRRHDHVPIAHGSPRRPDRRSTPPLRPLPLSAPSGTIDTLLALIDATRTGLQKKFHTNLATTLSGTRSRTRQFWKARYKAHSVTFRFFRVSHFRRFRGGKIVS